MIEEINDDTVVNPSEETTEEMPTEVETTPEMAESTEETTPEEPAA